MGQSALTSLFLQFLTGALDGLAAIVFGIEIAINFGI